MHHKIKPSTLFLLAFICLAANATAQTNLVFAIDVIRHGDRTPLGDLPSAKHQWTEGFGQLTATGMQQEFQMGSRMRAAYVDQYHLLSSNYTAREINVRSTDYERTLMSAQCFLMGLYPPGSGPTIPGSGQAALPGALQPIPIHTMPIKSDALLIPDSDGSHHRDLLIKYVLSTAEWQQKSAELQPKFKQWSDASGTKITELLQLVNLADAVYIDQLYHVPLPPDLAHDASEIIEAGHWVFLQSYKPRELGRITGAPLLNAIADYLKQAAEAKTRLKYVLFSAHDSTLLSELSALGAPLTNPPPYASRLNFALFQNADHTFHVEISFNDQPVTIPAFGGSSGSVEQLKALASEP